MALGVAITAVIGWHSPLRGHAIDHQRAPDIEAMI
jgi:hypothetical protein